MVWLSIINRFVLFYAHFIRLPDGIPVHCKECQTTDAMKLYGAIAIILAITFAGCKKNSDVDYNLHQEAVQLNLQSMLDELNTTFRKKYPGFPGGLALKVIGRNGEWFVQSGMESGMGDQIRFRAASITKTFTATAILLLMQEGKLNIDDKITDLIPGTAVPYVPDNSDYAIPFREQITLRMLLQNKAGVFDLCNSPIPDTVSVSVPYKGMIYTSYITSGDPYHTFTFDELTGVVSKCRLYYFRPGKGYHYSNTGYTILGKIIERVSGRSFGDFIRERILLPMKMEHSSMPSLGTDTLIPAPGARSFYYLPAVYDVTYQNMSANVAEGNLISTPSELAWFARRLFRGEGVLSSYTVNNIMLHPLVPPDTVRGYACGVEYYPNLGYGHGGDSPAFSTRMVSDPVSGFTCVVFTNAWNLSTGGDAGIIEQVKTLLMESCYRSRYIVGNAEGVKVGY